MVAEIVLFLVFSAIILSFGFNNTAQILHASDGSISTTIRAETPT